MNPLISILQNINEQNHSSMMHELEKMIREHGSVQVLLVIIHTLLPMAMSSKCNPTQLDLLKSSVLQTLNSREQVQFLKVLYDAGNRDLDGVSNVLKFSIPEQLLFGLTLVRFDPLLQDGLIYLKKRLHLFVSESNNLPQQLIPPFLYVVKSTNEFDKERAAILKHFEHQARNIHQKVHSGPSDVQNASVNFQQPPRVPQDHSGGKIGDLMVKCGYICTADANILSDIFKSAQIPINEVAVAHVLGAIAQTDVGQATNVFKDFVIAVLKRPYSLPKTLPTGWDLENVAKVIKENASRDMDWSLVIQSLDYPTFQLKDKKSLANLLVVFKKCSNIPFPIEKLIGTLWSNQNAQLAFIALGLALPPSALNYGSPKLHPVNIGNLQIGQKNHASWLYIEFYSTLLSLSESDGYSVGALFSEAIKNCPEQVLLGLASATPRTRDFQSDLFMRLFPKFLVVDSDTKKAPPVLNQLFVVNPTLFSRALANLYQVNPRCIYDVTHILRDLGLVQLLLAGTNFAFTIDLAVTSSIMEKDFTNLDLWLKTNFHKYSDIFLNHCLRFIQIKFEQKVPIPTEILALFFAPELEKIVSPQTFNQLSQTFQRLSEPMQQAIRMANPIFNVPEKVDMQSTKTFEKIFQNQISVQQAVLLVKKLKKSDELERKQLYDCMIHNLFDEYRFFPTYPDKEFTIVSELFGTFLQENVFQGETKEYAKLYVFNSLASLDDPMLLRFGIFAISHFLSILPKWPQYCALLSTLPQDTLKLIPNVKQCLVKVLKNGPEEKIQTENMFPSICDLGEIKRFSERKFAIPDQAVRDRFFVLINNLSHGNCKTTSQEIFRILPPEFYPFFSNYLVHERIAKQPTFHELYSEFLNAFNAKPLSQEILKTILNEAKLMLSNPQICHDLQLKSRLKNLGSFIGLRTIGINRPLPIRDLDLQALLIASYQNGSLLAVMPFICKILKAIAKSIVFKRPNPWTELMLSIMGEVHRTVDVDRNIRFEIEMLSTKLGLQLSSFEIRDPPILSGLKYKSLSGKESGQLHDRVLCTEFDLSKLSELPLLNPEVKETYKIRENIEVLRRCPQLIPLIISAVHHAINDIIPPVVKRSVLIACRTATELILKDFAYERDAAVMRQAGSIVAQNFAATLAMVTCKHPLRQSMENNIKKILSDYVVRPSDELMKQISECATQVCDDNIFLGCRIVEKAARESAHVEICKNLAHEVELRQNASRSPGHEYTQYRMSTVSEKLPQYLLSIKGVSQAHLKIYENMGANHIPQTALPTAQSIPPVEVTGKSVHAYPIDPLSFQKVRVQISNIINNILEHAKHLKKDARIFSLRPENVIISNLLMVESLMEQCHETNQIALFVGEAMMKLIFQATPNLLHGDICLVLLNQAIRLGKEVSSKITSLWLELPQEQKYSFTSIQFFLQEILERESADGDIAKEIESGNIKAIQFGLQIVNLGMQQKMNTDSIPNIMKSLRKSSRLANKDHELLNQIHQKSIEARQLMMTYDLNISNRDLVIQKYQSWFQIYQRNPRGIEEFEQFVAQHLQKFGLLKTDSDFLNMCKVLTQYVIDNFTETLQNQRQPTTINHSDHVKELFSNIDAYSTLVAIIIQMSPKKTKVTLLKKAVHVVSKFLLREHEIDATKFNQRPYLRIFSTLLIQLSEFQKDVYGELLEVFWHVFHNLAPQRTPGFTFAWLELISHRKFMPYMLKNPQTQEYYNILLIDLFHIMNPYLKKSELPQEIKLLYHGTLKILLVLLHDFAEFLCGYHFSLCDEIPSTCIQLRNLILSAYPQNMKLPDPLTKDLKVDLLDEIHLQPEIKSPYLKNLDPIKEPLDQYLKNRQPATFLNNLKFSLLLPTGEALETGQRYNIKLLNALVLYSAMFALENRSNPHYVNTSTMDIYQKLLLDMDSEGRYLFINSIVNHLRYPNSHTHYFSMVLLFLFGEVHLESDPELIQEQITRILLERLLVNRPHPWGLLITFIELVKNSRYKFFEKQFVNQDPNIKSIFSSIVP